MEQNKIQKFEDLKVWQEGLQLSVEIFKLTEKWKNFGIKDQMQRSSVSIPSNIAEGFERNSNKEFVQYLYISKASCGELRTQLYIAKAISTAGKESIEHFIEITRKISAMLYKLIQTRKENF